MWLAEPRLSGGRDGTVNYFQRVEEYHIAGFMLWRVGVDDAEGQEGETPRRPETRSLPATLPPAVDKIRRDGVAEDHYSDGFQV